MPNGISLALNNIRPPIDLLSKDIINNHTLFPLYSAFSPATIKRKVETEMEAAKNNTYTTTLGIATCLLKKNSQFRYCPLCVNDQIELYCEPYWDRRWFGLFNYCCPIHSVLLVPTPYAIHDFSRHAIRPLIDYLVENTAVLTTSIKPPWQGVLMSRMASHLLSHQTSFNYSALTNFYRKQALSFGFNRGQNIRQEVVADFVQSFWSWSWLQQQGFTKNYFNNTIATLFRKQRKQHQYIMHSIAGLPFFNGDIQLWWTKLLETQGPSRQVTLPDKTSIRSSKSALSLESNKQSWLALVKQFGPKNARYANEYSQKLYSAIYRADKDWLLKINQQYRVKRINAHSRISWSKRDFEITKVMFHKLYQASEIDVPRLSKRWFLSQLENSDTIEHNLYRLPKTSAFLERYSESVEDFQCRRLTKEAFKFANSKKTAKEWHMFRNARINTQRAISSQFRETCKWCVDWLVQNTK